MGPSNSFMSTFNEEQTTAVNSALNRLDLTRQLGESQDLDEQYRIYTDILNAAKNA